MKSDLGWLVLAAVALFAVGALALIAFFGIVKFRAAAKSAEALYSLGAIGRDATTVYAQDHHVCASASAPVPSSRRLVSGVRYQSAPDEWIADRAKNAGFYCLSFEILSPQYYQYDYRASDHDFNATARGDIDGDGVFSEFRITGAVSEGALMVAPTIMQKDARE